MALRMTSTVVTASNFALMRLRYHLMVGGVRFIHANFGNVEAKNTIPKDRIYYPKG